MCGARVFRWTGLATAVAGAACAGSSAPKEWLPKPVEAQATAYGGWIELTHQSSAEPRRTEGELIAVSADSVWVLSETHGVVIPTSAVGKGKLTVYAGQRGTLTTWTVLGALSTLSNGGFLIFTAPMWIIGGSIAIGGESRAAERKHPPLTWTELAAFARFPQGMPDGVELRALRTKKDAARVAPSSHAPTSGLTQ